MQFNSPSRGCGAQRSSQYPFLLDASVKSGSVAAAAAQFVHRFAAGKAVVEGPGGGGVQHGLQLLLKQAAQGDGPLPVQAAGHRRAVAQHRDLVPQPQAKGRARLLRAADACLKEEIQEAGLDKRLWQYYATLIQSPDEQNMYTICLRAIQASQSRGLAARLPFDLMERTTARILAEVPGVSRVVYDLTPSKHYGILE